jgi:hypothetical protein
MKPTNCVVALARMVLLAGMLLGSACSNSVLVYRDFNYFEPSAEKADVTGRFADGGRYEIGVDVGSDRLMVAGAYRNSPGIALRVELGRSHEIRFLSREFVFRQAAEERKVTVGYWSYPTASSLIEVRPYGGSLDFLALLEGRIPKGTSFSKAKFETHVSLPSGIDSSRPFTMEVPATSVSGPLTVTFNPKVAQYSERVPIGW